MKRLVVWLLSSLFFIAAAGLLAVAALMFWYQSYGPEASFEPLVIEPGTGSAKIAQQLEDAGWIDSALMFRTATMIKGIHAEFKAGEYQFSYGMSPQDIAGMLVQGQSITHAITVPEGKTSQEIIALLMKDERLTGVIGEVIPEGTLLPETHHVHRGDSRQSVIERLQRDHAALLDALWNKRQPDLPIQTKEEAVILASIVEKETGVDGERAKVASVFINRLRKGMKLQSDPTVVYAIELENGPMERPLYRKDWELEHPYNTYFIEGLPPGPICHPGKAAIEAVLNPLQTDYIFFVATGKGGHHFSRTLAEHNQNIVRYKQELRRQGQ